MVNTLQEIVDREKAKRRRFRKKFRAIVSGGGGGINTAPKGPRTALPATFQSINGFGHSIFAGSFASDAAHRMLNIFAASKGAVLLNMAIGGTWWTNYNATVNNGRDRFLTDILAANKREALAIMYLINEARTTAGLGPVLVSDWKLDAEETLIGCIQGGYPPSKIIISDDFWVTDARLANTAPPQPRAVYETFVSACKTVTDDFGCYRADTYEYIRDNGGDALVDGGDIPPLHPGDLGHAAGAVSLGQATMLDVGRITGITLAASGLTQLNVSWGAVAGAVSYEIDLFIRNTLTATVSGTSTTLSKNFPGLAAGDYNVRVRAIYFDNTHGPWGWNVISRLIGTALVLQADFEGYTGFINAGYTSEVGASTFVQQPNQAAPSAHSLVTNGRFFSNASASRSAYQATNIVPASADYTVGGFVSCRSLTTTGQIGVCGRMAGAADTYYFVRYTDNSGFSLNKRVAGANTPLGSNFARILNIDEIAKMELVMAGTTISMLVDGVSRASVTDAAIAAAGKPGLFTAGPDASATTGCQLDSLFMI